MKITIETGSYNDRRYSRPWIGVITDWPRGSARAEIAWGCWIGDEPGSAGMLEIEADAGDVVRQGQKDHRGNSGSNDWAIVQPDGSLRDCTAVEARKHWDAKHAPAPQVAEAVEMAGAGI